MRSEFSSCGCFYKHLGDCHEIEPGEKTPVIDSDDREEWASDAERDAGEFLLGEARPTTHTGYLI